MGLIFPFASLAGGHGVHMAVQQDGGGVLTAVENTHDIAVFIIDDFVIAQSGHFLAHQLGHFALLKRGTGGPHQLLRKGGCLFHQPITFSP